MGAGQYSEPRRSALGVLGQASRRALPPQPTPMVAALVANKRERLAHRRGLGRRVTALLCFPLPAAAATQNKANARDAVVVGAPRGRKPSPA